MARTLIFRRFLWHGSRYFRNVSTARPLQKAMRYVRNDPFIKLSASLCVLVIGGTLFVELYKRTKKIVSAPTRSLPPRFCHYAVKRKTLLLDLHNELKKVKANSNNQPAVLYIVGSRGCGKTELVCQFCDSYATKKWFGLKTVSPTVVSLNGISPEFLKLSIEDVACNLGLPRQLDLKDTFLAIVAKLSSKPWLLVVDNLTEESDSLFQTCVLSNVTTSSGSLLITTRHSDLAKGYSLFRVPRLSTLQSLDLLRNMSGLQVLDSNKSVLELLEMLHHHPMAVALASATIRHYRSFSSSESHDEISLYQNMLRALGDTTNWLETVLDLYFEVAVSDKSLRHTFDLFALCNWEYPVISSVLPLHLSSKLYGISSEILAPDPPSIFDPSKLPVEYSYWDWVKSMIPFFRTKVSSNNAVNALAASQDEVSFLHKSPIFSFQRGHKDVELVYVNSIAAPLLSKLFLEGTVVQFDHDHVLKDALEFERSAWFKRFRTFDPKKSLRNFHQSLPGLSSPGVFTEPQFAALPPDNFDTPQNIGIQIPRSLTFTQYLHIVSHYHRIVSSLSSALRSAKNDVVFSVLEKSLVPHLQIIKLSPFLSQADQLAIDISLVSVKALSENCLEQYKDLADQLKSLLGANSVIVAHVLVDLADLLLSMNHPSDAKEYLCYALQIYQHVPVQHHRLPLDEARALSSLGLASGQLQEMEQSKNFYEQALASAQSVAADGRVSVKQRQLVSSLLVDVTHSYLCLGELNVAKKYGELAMMMLQSLYPQGHLETVRLLNIQSIVSALLGAREDSMNFQTEASKLKSKM